MQVPQRAKLPTVSASLPSSVAATLVILKPEFPYKTVVDAEQQVQIVKARLHSETPLPSHMKRKDAAFAVSTLSFHDSGRITITATRARRSVWMTLS